MSITFSASEEIEAPTDTTTSTAAELNGSPAKPISKTVLSNALNSTVAANTTAKSKIPQVSFLFGAGAEAYYGMPLGARFAVEIFRRQVELFCVEADGAFLLVVLAQHYHELLEVAGAFVEEFFVDGTLFRVREVVVGGTAYLEE